MLKLNQLIMGLVIVFGMSLSVFADMASARSAIEKSGGLVLKIAQNVDAYEVTFPGSAKNVTDDLLKHFKDIPKLKRVNIAGAKITDGGLKHLSGLSDLTHLHLERTAVGDAGLKHLVKLSKVEYLNLYGTQVSDAGLNALKQMKGLKRVMKLPERAIALTQFCLVGLIWRPIYALK